MYNLVINSNRVLVVLALAAGLASVIYFPGQYSQQIVEIPLLALFAGELGLALFCSLLFYENAAPPQIIKLAASIFGFEMLVGTVGNWSGQLTQSLPDSFVLVSWVQLIIMNTAGIFCTLALYRLKPPEESQQLRSRLTAPIVVQPPAGRGEPGPIMTSDTLDPGPPQDFTPPPEGNEAGTEAKPKRLQSVKEILEGLDISRIMRLEKSIHPPEPPAMETLFKEESQAAEATAGKEAAEASANAVQPGVFHMSGGTDSPEAIKAFDFSPHKLITADPVQPAAETSPILSKLLPEGTPLTISGDDGAIPLSAPPPIVDDEIPLTAAPIPFGKDAIPLAPVQVTLDEEAIPLSAPPVSLEDSLDEMIPLAEVTDSQLEGEDMPAASDSAATAMPAGIPVGPSLQELLKAEPMTGPLEAIEEEPAAADVPPDTVASSSLKKSSSEETEESVYSDEVVEEDLDEAFKKLVPREALRNVSKETLAQLRDLRALQKQRESEEPDDFDGIRPAANDDITELIKSLAEKEQESQLSDLISPDELTGQETTEPPRHAEPKEVKDFGRLSAKASAKAVDDADSSGSMKSIGKMLIDAQAVENIIKHGERRAGGMTTAKIVSAKRGEAIHSLLTYIDHFPGVTGSLIVGNDGLVITSTVDPSIDKDMLGAMSLAIHGNSDIASGKLNLGSVREIVLQTNTRLTVLRKLDDGILVVLSDTPQAGRVDGLLKLLASLMRGKPEEGDEPADTAASASPAPAASPTQAPAAKAAPPVSEEPVTLPAPEAPAAPAKPAPAAAAQASPAEETEESDSTPTRAPVAADLVRDLIASLSSPKPEQMEEAKPQVTIPAPKASPEREPAEAAFSPEPMAYGAPDAHSSEQPGNGGSATFSRQAAPAEPAPLAIPLDETPAEAEPKQPAFEAAAKSAAPESVKSVTDSTTQAAPTKEVKEFGRLSSQSGTIPSAQDESSGTMSIGKMLIDVQAVANIIKTAEKRGSGLTTARVISAARGEGIRSLLGKIDNYPGVAGSLIVGRDGLVIASTLGASVDKDTLGAMSTSMHSHTNVVTEKLELGVLHQAVLYAKDKITVLTNVEVGVLVVLFESAEIGLLDGLLHAIEETVQS